MTNIVVYGKPRAFESYEYCFGSDVVNTLENAHREPVLKPKRYDDAVLHYFVKDGNAGLEYYTRAKGFESDRDGIVFGIAVKSDRDFILTDTVKNMLVPFWEDLAGALLDNSNKFQVPNIIDLLKDTQWSEDEILTIQSVAKHTPIKQANKELLLLVAPDVAEISNIETQIKDYSDVYIADNVDIFKDPINKVLLQAANNQIFTITNGTITLIETKQREGGVKKKRATKWGSKKTDGSSHNGQSTSSNDDGVGFENGHNNGTKRSVNIGSILGIAAVVLALIVGGYFLLKNPNPKPGSNVSGGGGETPSSVVVQSPAPQENFTANSVQLAKYDNPIKTDLDLKPKPLYNGSAEQCLTMAREISLELSGAGASFAKIEDNTLTVKKQPTADTKVTVIAKLNGTKLGQQDYMIAKKDVVQTPSTTAKYAKVLIHFGDNKNKNTVFFRGEKITVTAKSGKETCTGGRWKFDNGLWADKNINPTTVEILSTCTSGNHILSYCYTNSEGKEVEADVTIIVSL
ncbi:MAG: hypothetical protein LBS50_09160 [Prevotellaceae bacterium]|jgi:hypothetical protein|nr:hypothetical protein [Prevotellaceae bacterium]